MFSADGRRSPGRWVWLGCVAALVVAACGSSGGGTAKLKLAEKHVSDAQQAVSDAQADLSAKSAEFCRASQSYITGLDRYGNVLNETAPTVGDVRDAGADLQQPAADAVSSAEAAVAAQQQLVAAENGLTDARAELAAAQAETSGKSTERAAPTTTPPTTTPSTTTAPSPTVTPLAPSATVNRVKQAEAEFAAAQSGITDQTPLDQASQQFNAAAVALEMSWLRLFADAGCLTDDQQKKADAAVRDYTVALQKSLAQAGYYHHELDGVYGPATVDAIEALQTAHGLPVTGTVDEATDAALQADLQAKGGAAAQEALASTAAVQQTLKLAGYWTGPVDGTWTPALTDALKSFQTALGVKATGTVDAATIAALEHAIATAKAPQPSSSAAGQSPAATQSS
ncbi:MAG TPA: peptidoglycan-binding domain-containing protein [Jatrophihabitans sp.]|jgi:peptidoglycan hydrolase-like protein with peptidoglycan-binding domain|nr:peptidoglycan-binding domain-containing protein [Jatrophihabitans sp.]